MFSAKDERRFRRKLLTWSTNNRAMEVMSASIRHAVGALHADMEVPGLALKVLREKYTPEELGDLADTQVESYDNECGSEDEGISSDARRAGGDDKTGTHETNKAKAARESRKDTMTAMVKSMYFAIGHFPDGDEVPRTVFKVLSEFYSMDEATGGGDSSEDDSLGNFIEKEEEDLDEQIKQLRRRADEGKADEHELSLLQDLRKLCERQEDHSGPPRA